MDHMNPFRAVVICMFVWSLIFSITWVLVLVYFGKNYHLALLPLLLSVLGSLIAGIFSSMQWKKKQKVIRLANSSAIYSDVRALSKLFTYSLTMILLQVSLTLFIVFAVVVNLVALLDIALHTGRP